MAKPFPFKIYEAPEIFKRKNTFRRKKMGRTRVLGHPSQKLSFNILKKTFIDRTAIPVKNVSAPVFRPNGKLFFRNKGQDYVCSGAAVDKHAFLTAAHCIFNKDSKT